MTTTFVKSSIHTIYIFIAAFLLIHCDRSHHVEQTHTNSPLKINLKEAYLIEQSIPLSEIASEIKYVPLETLEDHAVGRIFRLFASDQEFVIWHEEKVSVFDMEGIELTMIDAEGKGPGEYIGINDVAVDFEAKEIFILDQRKVMIYSFEGNHISSTPFEMRLSNMGILADKTVCGYLPDIFLQDSAENCNLMLLNNQGGVEKQFCHGEPHDNSLFYAVTTWFYRLKGQLYHKDPFEDMIYRIENDSLIPHINIALEDMLLPRWAFESKENYLGNYFNYIAFGDIHETESLLFFDYIFQKERGKFLYHKDSHKFWNQLSEEGISSIDNDVDGVPFWPRAVSGNMLYNLIEAYEFKEWVENNQANAALKELALGLKDTDNPVIQVAYLD